MAFLTTHDGTELFYRDWGTGDPVVLIHGWPLSGDMWDKQSTFLAENGHRVLVYDRRGFGRSGQPWSGYDYDTLAGDLQQLLETLNIQNATLVGFSMGGGEVVRYLSRFGTQRVKQAVLVSAVTPYLLQGPDNPEGVDPKVFEQIEQSIRQDRPAFFEDFGPKFYGRSTLKHTVSQPVLEWTQSMAMTASMRSTLACAQSWSSTDFRAEMKAINIPVLVIHGTSDSTVPLQASGKRAAAILPNATLLEYDGEPHGLFLTAADRLNADLLQFIGPGERAPLTDPKLS